MLLTEVATSTHMSYFTRAGTQWGLKLAQRQETPKVLLMQCRDHWQAGQQERLYHSTLLVAWGVKYLVQISELLTMVQRPCGVHVFQSMPLYGIA